MSLVRDFLREDEKSENKTSTQRTPGSQVYHSNQKIIVGKNDFLNKNKKHRNYA